MRSLCTKSLVIIILVGMFTLISGCTLVQKDFFSKQTPVIRQTPSVTPTPSHEEKYWIRINPIEDYNTDSPFNITGSTMLVVSGTTNYPSGTLLHFTILEENNDRDVMRTNLEINGNSSGPNLFSYEYDMKGNPPGRYRVILADSTFSRFNITAFDKSDLPSSRWIHMEPIGEAREGKNIQISGTTDLPPGTKITVGYSMLAHSCTPSPTPDKGGRGTFCGGTCRGGDASSQIVQVVEGGGGVNTWNSTINTTKWCWEIYSLGARASNLSNVTPVSQYIRLTSTPTPEY